MPFLLSKKGLDAKAKKRLLELQKLGQRGSGAKSKQKPIAAKKSPRGSVRAKGAR